MIRAITLSIIAGFLTSSGIAAITALSSRFDLTLARCEVARLTRTSAGWELRTPTSKLRPQLKDAQSRAELIEPFIDQEWINRPLRENRLRTDFCIDVTHGPGVDWTQVIVLDIGDASSGGGYLIHHVEAGWPLRSFSGLSRGPHKAPADVVHGIAVSASVRRTTDQISYDRFIPIRPLPGLAVNTAFYAGLYFVAAFAIKSTIRRRRVRRQRCPSCGYQRTGLAPDSPCPECASPSAGTK